MTAPDLWSVPLPIHPTETQLAAAERLAPHVAGMRAAIFDYVFRSREEGCTAGECAFDLKLDIVTVRARLTEAHQAREIVRTAQRRDGQLCYVAIPFFDPVMGTRPSKRHRGMK